MVSKKMMRLYGVVILLLVSMTLFADSTLEVPKSVTNGSSSGCSYYYIDGFTGVVLLGGTTTPIPQGVNITLTYYNNGVPATMTPQVACTGKYQISFNFDIQATTNDPVITIQPSITTYNGVTVYPPVQNPPVASTPISIYPMCNNAGYTQPYCTISPISDTSIVSLNQGDQINAPVLKSSKIVKVVSGTLIVNYLGQ